jgi:hypothetical protein
MIQHEAERSRALLIHAAADGARAHRAANSVGPTDGVGPGVGLGINGTAIQRLALSLQRSAGNRATTQVLLDLQRCGGERHAGCDCVSESSESPVPASVQRDQPAAGGAAAKFDLPSGSAFNGFGAGLLDILRRSFRDRVEGGSGAEKNLDNAFWAGTPKDFEQALVRLGTAGANLLQEIWDRSGSSLFKSLKYIQNLWSGTSRGFKFVTLDIPGLEKDLIGHSSFCRDTPTGESEHKPSRCYRELVAGAHGLHYCLHETGGCEIHIDMHQTVKKKDDDGTCAYSWRSLPKHWGEVFLGFSGESPFEKVDRTKAKIESLRKQVEKMPLSDSRVPNALKALASMEPKIQATETKARDLAVKGEAGEREAQGSIMPTVTAILDEAINLDLTLNPPLPEFGGGF